MIAAARARLTAVYGAARSREPWSVLVPLLLVHWLALGLFVLSVNHNGWLFYQGGDEIWHWTTGWLLGSGEITEPLVAQGWALVVAPFALLFGSGFVSGLAGPILLQVIVLAPVALWCMYELGARIGGRVVGYAAAAIWTLVPYAVIPLFEQRYHAKYVEQFLPHPLGLTAMADQAGVVVLILAALFALRAAQDRDPRAALLAGLFAGFAALIKPSNLLFLPAPFVALAAARRWREGLALALSLAPGLGALTLWKDQGFGYIPAFTYQEVHVALGGDTIVNAVKDPYNRYVDIDWRHLHINLLGLGEVFWSVRVLQWLPVAGAIAVSRRSVPMALCLSIWFWIFFVIKGSAADASVDSGSFFRFLMPAFPALVLMVAALPVLVPRYGVELARRTAVGRARRARWWVIGIAVVALGVVPLVSAAVVSPLEGPDRSVQYSGIAVPVDFDLRGAVAGGTVQLQWDAPASGGVKVFYRVLRRKGSFDYGCNASTYGGADECAVLAEPVQTTRRTQAVDAPAPGTWTYRIAVAANWVDDTTLGEVYMVSRPVTVTVP